MIPLQWSGLIQETLSESSAGKGRRTKERGESCREVLNRHQRLDMPFSQRMNILRLPFLSLQQPTKPMLPSAQTSYQSARLSPVKMKDMTVVPVLHVTYRVELIDICIVRCWLNLSKAKVCFHRKHSHEGRGINVLILFNHGLWVSG